MLMPSCNRYSAGEANVSAWSPPFCGASASSPKGTAGVRKRGTAERITIADQFHLGSCTKAMTATLVAMLVEEGKLNWTTTLGELFADTVKPLHPAWEKGDIAAGSRTPRRLAP
jgi:hypothetical protein